jgi:hypothetical protein
MILPLLILCAAASAGEKDPRASLSGTWQQSASKWVIEEKSDSIHVTYSENGQVQSEFECAIGRECETSAGAHKAKVSLWFNGPKLVQMETRGNEVLKRRFSANGDELELELIPINPDGKPQVLKLKRVKSQ